MNEYIHWGEIIERDKDSFVPDVSADIKRSMNKFCLAEFESEYETDQLQCTEQIMYVFNLRIFNQKVLKIFTYIYILLIYTCGIVID